jgi:hypothetical protein
MLDFFFANIRRWILIHVITELPGFGYQQSALVYAKRPGTSLMEYKSLQPHPTKAYDKVTGQGLQRHT